MPRRQRQIELTPDERRQYLEQGKTIVLSTIDGHGYPHSVAMWYALEGDVVLMTTYAKSQKAVNIRRNPKVCLLIESGETYDSLKGVLIRGRAEVIESVDACVAVLSAVHRRMSGSFPPGIEDALRQQARKRVMIRVTPERVSSWDHRKLGGVY